MWRSVVFWSLKSKIADVQIITPEIATSYDPSRYTIHYNGKHCKIINIVYKIILGAMGSCI